MLLTEAGRNVRSLEESVVGASLAIEMMCFGDAIFE
jgi:hypothetical protein